MDETIQKAICHLTTEGEIRWRDFPPVGVEDHFHAWYYAEDRQFIIRDVMMDTFFFVKARSPKEAYEIYRSRLEEVMRAGAYVEVEHEND